MYWSCSTGAKNLAAGQSWESAVTRRLAISIGKGFRPHSVWPCRCRESGSLVVGRFHCIVKLVQKASQHCKITSSCGRAADVGIHQALCYGF